MCSNRNNLDSRATKRAELFVKTKYVPRQAASQARGFNPASSRNTILASLWLCAT